MRETHKRKLETLTLPTYYISAFDLTYLDANSLKNIHTHTQTIAIFHAASTLQVLLHKRFLRNHLKKLQILLSPPLLDQ